MTIAIAAAIGTVGLAIGTVTAWQWNRRTNAERLVQAVLTASPAKLATLIEELPPFRGWTDPRFRAKLVDEQTDRETRLRASLALAPVDPSQAGYLQAQMLACSFDEFPLIRDAIKARVTATEIRQLWPTLRDPGKPESARFRAGLALAAFASENSEWTDADALFLVGHLLAVNPEYQRDLRSHLSPVHMRLVKPLRDHFGNTDFRERVREMAAVALADYGRDNPALLAELLGEAIPVQYGHFFDTIASLPG